MRRALAIALVLAAAACSKRREAGLQVTVELAQGFTSRCLQVAAKHPSGELRSTAVPITGKSSVVIGVAQGALPKEITLYAEGFSDESCATLSSPPERSPSVNGIFVQNEVGQVTLKLPAASATRETACADGLDSDGDGRTDCRDTDCEGLPCLAGGTCAMGACRGAQGERGLCEDGVDNDTDGDVDCADTDCLGSACRAADLCVTSSTCNAAKQCGGGSAKVCNPMAVQCSTGVGSCDPATGSCVYAPADAGTPCTDGDACSAPDLCNGSGMCIAGALLSCTTPPPCFTAAGAFCSPTRGCQYLPTPGLSCDDGVSCSVSDQCQADGGCAGTVTPCAASECQSFAGQCGADAGCVFTSLDAGTACDAGVCNGGGACIRSFPYPPANFTEAQVPSAPAGDVVLDCGVSVVDTQASGAPVFMNWCGRPLPGAATISQPGGPDAVLLSFGRLTVALGSTLRLTGPRPVIIAALGDVTVAGLVEASSGASDCADGGFGIVGGEGLTNGGGGGASFGGPGARGGAGSITAGTSGGGGAAGVVNGSEALVPLRGGCTGARGARSGVPRAAAGGGAVQISSAATIVISGAISAPGQGGPAGSNGTGGNGAGSGGAIALEALQLTLTAPAVLAAHGGGGGEGGGPLIDGEPGRPGTADAGAAQGGDDFGNSGGPGGHGATLTQAAAVGADGVLGTGNGGGGGGGLGRIRVRATACSVGVGVLVSPAFPPDGGC